MWKFCFFWMRQLTCIKNQEQSTFWQRTQTFARIVSVHLVARYQWGHRWTFSQKTEQLILNNLCLCCCQMETLRMPQLDMQFGTSCLPTKFWWWRHFFWKTKSPRRLESWDNRGHSPGWPHLNSIHDGLEVRLGAKLGSSIGNLWTKAPTWTTYQLSRHTEKFVYHPYVWRSNCTLSIPFPIVLDIVFGWYWLNHTLRTKAILNESAKDIVIFHLSSWSFASLTSVKKCTFVTGIDAWSNLKLGHLKKKDLNPLQFLYFFIFFLLCFKKAFVALGSVGFTRWADPAHPLCTVVRWSRMLLPIRDCDFSGTGLIHVWLEQGKA